VNLFDKSFCQDITKILVWFSGKDLLSALEPWCIVKEYQNAAAFRETLTNNLINGGGVIPNKYVPFYQNGKP
jgi:hypothetical protein